MFLEKKIEEIIIQKTFSLKITHTLKNDKNKIYIQFSLNYSWFILRKMFSKKIKSTTRRVKIRLFHSGSFLLKIFDRNPSDCKRWLYVRSRCKDLEKKIQSVSDRRSWLEIANFTFWNNTYTHFTLVRVVINYSYVLEKMSSFPWFDSV